MSRTVCTEVDTADTSETTETLSAGSAAVVADTRGSSAIKVSLKKSVDPEEADTLPAEATSDASRGNDHPPFLVRRWRGAVVVLAVLLIGLCVAAGFLLVALRSSDNRTADRSAVVDVASQVATGLTTIGADNAQANISALLGQATGPFHDQLTGYSSVLQAILQQGKVVSNGSVSGVAVEKLDGDQATAVVVTSGTVKNTQITAGQLRTYRLSVSLQRVDGHWLASDVEFVA